MTVRPDIDPCVTLDPYGVTPMFRAIDRNTYDVDCDAGGFFSNSPTGYGATPLDAIVDLLDNMDGRAWRRPGFFSCSVEQWRAVYQSTKPELES